MLPLLWIFGAALRLHTFEAGSATAPAAKQPAKRVLLAEGGEAPLMKEAVAFWNHAALYLPEAVQGFGGAATSGEL